MLNLLTRLAKTLDKEPIPFEAVVRHDLVAIWKHLLRQEGDLED